MQLALIVIFALLFCCTSAQISWTGEWTSHYAEPASPAERFYICVDEASGIMEGMYSQVGAISGLLVRNTDGTQTFNGTYYEAGREGPSFQNGTGTSTQPAWGFIRLTLAADGQSFSGIWSYATNPNPYGSPDGTWSETRISSNSPSAYLCFSSISDTNAPQSANGRWSGALSGFADICITQSPSMASYEQSSSGVSVFMYGQCFLGGTLCQYNYATDEDIAGIMLVRSAFGRLWWVQWEFPTIDDWTYDLQVQAPRTNWTLSSQQPNGCARNLYLQSGLRGAASSAVLSLGLALLAAAVLLL